MAKGKRRVQHAEIVDLFASRLREARASAGLTQAELAEQAHVTVSYIWRLESAGAAPSIDLVDRLAKALGLKASEMLVTPPDDLGALRDQAKRLFESVLKSADRNDLVALNPILARFTRTR
jgi:transcriptional regulator with XRE-family HTH domain